MNRKILAVLVTAFGLTACLNTSEPSGSQTNYGFLILEAQAGDPGYVVDPIGLFYRTGPLNLPSTGNATNQCVDILYQFTEQTPIYPPTVHAGAAIQMSMSGTTLDLNRINVNGTWMYRPATGDVLPFTPGNLVTLSIAEPPAEGFPTWTLEARTAEAFTHEPVVAPAETQEVTLVWDAAPAAGSTMVVSMRYRPNSAPTTTRQVYCELVDDGSHVLSAGLVEDWRVAEAASRETVFARWRVTGETKPGAVLLAISTFEVPTPVGP